MKLSMAIFAVMLLAAVGLGTERGVITSNSISFSCFGNNSQYAGSCCQTLGGQHCNLRNEGTLTFPRTINPGDVDTATVYATAVNTQTGSERTVVFFINDMQYYESFTIPANGSANLEIDATSGVRAIEYNFSSVTVAFDNNDAGEVTINNIQMTIELKEGAQNSGGSDNTLLIGIIVIVVLVVFIIIGMLIVMMRKKR